LARIAADGYAAAMGRAKAKPKPKPAKKAKAKPAARKATKKAKPAVKSKPAAPPAPIAPPRPASELPIVVAPVRVVPPAPPGEIGAVREVGRLIRHGEVFGKYRIETRMQPSPVVITSGRIAVGDPSKPSQARVLAHQTAPGKFRVMTSVANIDGEERVAAVVMHAGRPPIARWVIAHFEGQKPPKTADQAPGFDIGGEVAGIMDALALDALRGDPGDLAQKLAERQGVAAIDHVVDGATGHNVLAFPSGWGSGTYSAYWALDGAGHPVCLVIDFDVFNKADWKTPKSARR
jgi:hypothetical protein